MARAALSTFDELAAMLGHILSEIAILRIQAASL